MTNCYYEHRCFKRGLTLVAGVDEAGRGSLAGPVVAAAVMFPQSLFFNQRQIPILEINDSKKLSPKKREELYKIIYEKAQSIGIGIVSHTIIDQINIYQATMKAMADAVKQLSPQPHHLLVDGPSFCDTHIKATPIIKGDTICFSIAAASIIAKVTRDRLMVELDAQFPMYGFAKHKGYATREHRLRINELGPSKIHRLSFSLMKKGIKGWQEKLI